MIYLYSTHAEMMLITFSDFNDISNLIQNEDPLDLNSDTEIESYQTTKTNN